MIFVGLALAAGISTAGISSYSLNPELYKNPPIVFKRHLEKEPMINFNSLFSFETNNNSAFVAHNPVSSYINSGEGDYMLSSVKHKVRTSGRVVMSHRAANLIEDFNYFEFTDNIELNTPVKKKIRVKAKVVSSKMADYKLV